MFVKRWRWWSSPVCIGSPEYSFQKCWPAQHKPFLRQSSACYQKRAAAIPRQYEFIFMATSKPDDSDYKRNYYRPDAIMRRTNRIRSVSSSEAGGGWGWQLLVMMSADDVAGAGAGAVASRCMSSSSLIVNLRGQTIHIGGLAVGLLGGGGLVGWFGSVRWLTGRHRDTAASDAYADRLGGRGWGCGCGDVTERTHE